MRHTARQRGKLPLRGYAGLLLVLLLSAVLIIAVTGCQPSVEKQTGTESGTGVTGADEPTADGTDEVQTDTPSAGSETVTDGAPGTDAATETEPETDAPTETEPETEVVYEPESNKIVIESFDVGATTVLDSLDWTNSQFGITNPEFSVAKDDAVTDIDRGLRVTLKGLAACQYLQNRNATVKDAFDALPGTAFKYMRIWVSNETGGLLGIACIYEGPFGQTASDGDVIEVCLPDGRPVAVTRGDPSGMGEGHNTAVFLPDGFRGWVSFPLTGLCSLRGAAVPDSLTDGTSRVTGVIFDMRPTGYMPDGSYILDELTLSETPYGNRRTYHGKDIGIIMTVEEKQEKIQKDFAVAAKTVPACVEVPEFRPTEKKYTDITALTFDGMDRNGKKTKVFAYIGFPEGASADSPVPGVVLVHGGGGHPFLEWVKMWNDRGYAAIALETTGYFPTEVNAGLTEVYGGYGYGLSGVFTEAGYTSSPDNDGMSSSTGPVENMWMYHAVGDTLLATNLLASYPCVDAEKIGVTGISWGGVITAIVIGYQPDYAFAIPVYGSGYLEEALSWMGDNFAGADTQALWSAADRFSLVDFPVLWLCWNDDNCFSVNSSSKSFLDTVKVNPNTRISIKNNMMHSHGSAWTPSESIAFADSVVMGKSGFAGFETQPAGRDVSVRLSIPEGTTVSPSAAKLYYFTGPMTYSEHEKYGYSSTFLDPVWQVADAAYDPATQTVTAKVPADATGYYVEITCKAGRSRVISTSAFVKLQ